MYTVLQYGENNMQIAVTAIGLTRIKYSSDHAVFHIFNFSGICQQNCQLGCKKKIKKPDILISFCQPSI